MIQLIIDDNMKVNFIVGNQRILCDRVDIDVKSGWSPDINIYGMYAVQNEGEDEHGR